MYSSLKQRGESGKVTAQILKGLEAGEHPRDIRKELNLTYNEWHSFIDRIERKYIFDIREDIDKIQDDAKKVKKAKEDAKKKHNINRKNFSRSFKR